MLKAFKMIWICSELKPQGSYAHRSPSLWSHPQYLKKSLLWSIFLFESFSLTLTGFRILLTKVPKTHRYLISGILGQFSSMVGVKPNQDSFNCGHVGYTWLWTLVNRTFSSSLKSEEISKYKHPLRLSLLHKAFEHEEVQINRGDHRSSITNETVFSIRGLNPGGNVLLLLNISSI